jgi:hypothetical protein
LWLYQDLLVTFRDGEMGGKLSIKQGEVGKEKLEFK